MYFIPDEGDENHPCSPFKTPSPSKKKREEKQVIQRQGETPVRASLAAKLAAAKLEDENKRSRSAYIYVCHCNEKAEFATILPLYFVYIYLVGVVLLFRNLIKLHLSQFCEDCLTCVTAKQSLTDEIKSKVKKVRNCQINVNTENITCCFFV